MPSSGPNSPGTLADDAGVGTIAWTDPSNASSSNDSYAVASLTSIGGTTHYLKVTNFGFAIPAGSTIDGIVLEVEKKKSAGAPTTNDERVRIVKDGTIGSTDRSGSAWSETEAYVTYGSSSDLWGETLTVDDINDSTFGAAVAATGMLGAGGYSLSIDHMRITVYYTAGGAGKSLMACRRRRSS